MTVTLFTLGHSRHTAEHFVALLHAHEIKQLVDVRSQPYSKRAPHFDTHALSRLLAVHGVDYILGRQLGGRPLGREFYRKDGTVDYARRASAPDFTDGIFRLVALAALGRRTVILCAEEDPTKCHRRLLVAPALVRAGASVVHVRGDGRLEPERGLVPDATQLDLFGERS